MEDLIGYSKKMDNNYGYIYKTTNLINNKVYIGKCKGIFNVNYLGSGKILKKAIKKYSVRNFSVELVKYAKTKEKLNKLEKDYIRKLKKSLSKDRIYNIASGGEGFTSHHSTTTKKRLSELNSKENNPMFGKKKENCPAYGKHWKWSSESKQAVLGKNHHNYREDIIINFNLFKDLYFEQQYSIEQIAKLWNISKNILFSRCKKEGIKFRNYKEAREIKKQKLGIQEVRNK